MAEQSRAEQSRIIWSLPYFLSALLLVASLSKVGSSEVLTALILRIQLVPDAAAVATGRLIVFVELGLGVALLFSALRPIAYYALVPFAAAMFSTNVFRLIIGDQGSCGCMGSVAELLPMHSALLSGAFLVVSSFAIITTRYSQYEPGKYPVVTG